MKFQFKPKAFYRIIQVRESLGCDVIESLAWHNMKLDHVVRWEWYFKYRAALLQIKYPKYRVDFIRGSAEPEGRTKTQIQADSLKRRKTTCKRMITKIGNWINEYSNHQKTLLIQDFKDPNYLKAVKKLESYKTELLKLN